MQGLKRILRESLPRPLLSAFRQARATVRRWQYGGSDYYCNVCDSYLKSWIYAGPVDHGNRVCPVCNSYGRHRMMALVLEHELDTFDSGQSLLHFAPEIGLQRWIKRHMSRAKYLSTDLDSPEVDINMDVQRMNLPNASIDVVLLSHVLEHIEDDMQALREIHRVLVPGGKLFLQVPLSGMAVTQEEKLATANERLVSYGKTDHVRLYGDDINARLANAGFEVTAYRSSDEIFREKWSYMALDILPTSTMLYDNESSTFVCRKCIVVFRRSDHA